MNWSVKQLCLFGLFMFILNSCWTKQGYGPRKQCLHLCVCVRAPHMSQTASLSSVSVSLAFPVVRLPPKSILVAFLQLLADKLAGGR